MEVVLAHLVDFSKVLEHQPFRLVLVLALVLVLPWMSTSHKRIDVEKKFQRCREKKFRLRMCGIVLRFRSFFGGGTYVYFPDFDFFMENNWKTLTSN